MYNLLISIPGGGSKIGNAHLKWAFSEAAVLFIRCSEERKKYYEKLKRKHGRGKCLSVLAAKLGRAVYYMLKEDICILLLTRIQRITGIDDYRMPEGT